MPCEVRGPLAWLPPPLAIAAPMLFCACPGELREPDRFSDNYCIHVTESIFNNRCVFGCHGAQSQQGDLDLESPNVGQRLANAPSTPECGGVLAAPGNPTASILYQKLTLSPPCGDRMPLYDDPLTSEQQDCVLEWIARQ